MAKKMYYTAQEAADILGITLDELAKHVRDDKLRVFQDGSERMFKTEEVDALAGGGEAEEEIELAPADQVSLEAAETEEPKGKEDTVITAEGISIFDDEDLEIEAADPMAKTQITPALEEQMTLEGVGSGSGLLDLTRESDDTSLGAEVLDHIDMEEGLESGIGVGEEASGPYEAAGPPAAAEGPAVYEETIDAASGLFGGMLIGCALVSALIAAVMLAAMQGILPPYLQFMKDQIAVVLGGAVAAIIVFAVIGLLTGMSAAARRRAMGRVGG